MRHSRPTFWLMIAILLLTPLLGHISDPAVVEAINSNDQNWTPVDGPDPCPQSPVPGTVDAVFSINQACAPVISGADTTFDTAEIFPPAVIRDTASVAQPCGNLTSGLCYRMWYVGVDSAQTRRIGYAVSTDGISWNRVRGNATGGAVFEGSGVTGDFDSNGVTTNTVLKVGDTFHMWYTGRGASRIEGIGYATSTDGINWTRVPGSAGSPANENNNAVLVERGGASDFDGSYIIGPYVLRDIASAALPCEAGRTSGVCFRMWYEGSDSSNVFRNGYAVSPNGIAWTQVLGTAGGGSVLAGSGFGSGFDENVVGLPMVLREGNVFHMWYQAKDFSDNAFRIGHVTSPDGINWVRPDPNVPVFEATNIASTPYVDRVWAHRIQKTGANYRMWFATSDQVDVPGVGSDSDRFGLVQMTPGNTLSGLNLTRASGTLTYTLNFNLGTAINPGTTVAPGVSLNPQVLITLPPDVSLSNFNAGTISGFSGASMAVSYVSDIETQNGVRQVIAVNLPNGAGTGPKSINFSLGNVAIPSSMLVQVFDTHKVVEYGNLGNIADIQISKTDGATSQIAGTTVTYTVVVSNPSSNTVNNVLVNDTLPASLAGVTWTCAGSSGATCPANGSGNLSNVSVNLPGGSQVTFTITGTLNASASGTLSNTATATVPAGVTDPTSSNNTATDTSAIERRANLVVTLTRTTDPVIAGAAIEYTIAVANAGPSNANGVSVLQTLSDEIENVGWTCTSANGAACPSSSGTGVINTSSVNLPATGIVTFTVSGDVPSSWTGNIATSVSTTAPAGVTDPNTANNSANDTVGTIQVADLAISKTVSPATLVPGNPITYTLVITNNGPSDANGATVIDTFPSEISGISWTCSATTGSTCPASGSGNINHTLSLTASHVATFIINGTIAGNARGNLVNSATVSVPGGVQDNVGSNNSSISDQALSPQVDVAVQLTSTTAALVPGLAASYTITVTNSGPSTALGTRLVDTLPEDFSNVTWNCTASGGAICPAASGSGDIDETFDLVRNGRLVFVINGTINSRAAGDFVNSATVTVAGNETDTNPNNNEDTSTRTLSPRVDLQLALTAAPTPLVPGLAMAYTLTLDNGGPSDSYGATLVTTLPVSLTSAIWTCTPTGGATCPTDGTGAINTQLNIPAGSRMTFVTNGMIPPVARGTF
ncbi:MAG TPA: hypothetical protein PKA05_15370, partial [Roseiflexaceae bacterium]|nr:hypothetical protein [Roseiflexaceae bacterium]